MKLAVSCMAWSADEHAAAAALLHAHGAMGIELLPTALWGDWASALAAGPADLPAPLQDFARPAMQSLLFNMPDHLLFQDEAAEERMIAHLQHVIALAERLHVRVLVFGSPRQRLRGSLSMPAAMARFGSFATRLAPVAAAAGVKLALEANPVAYGCDFVTGTAELLDVFEALDQPGLGLHFDTGTAILNGEDLAGLIRRAGPRLDHFHISQPQLGGCDEPAPLHMATAEALRDIGYPNWVSIEMRRGERGLADLELALRQVVATYGPLKSVGTA